MVRDLACDDDFARVVRAACRRAADTDATECAFNNVGAAPFGWVWQVNSAALLGTVSRSHVDGLSARITRVRLALRVAAVVDPFDFKFIDHRTPRNPTGLFCR